MRVVMVSVHGPLEAGNQQHGDLMRVQTHLFRQRTKYCSSTDWLNATANTEA